MPRRAVSRWLLAVVAGSFVAACYWVTPYSDLSSADGVDAAVPVDATGALDADAVADADAASVDPDLVACWTFEGDEAGIARDRSGHGYDLLLEDAIVAAPGHDSGTALEYPDGTGVAHNDALGPEFPAAGTLSWWASFPAPATDRQRAIFDGYDPTRHHLYIRHSGGGDAAAQPLDFVSEIDAGFEVFAFPAPVVATGRWTHLVVVWDRTVLPKNYAWLYIDGYQVGGASFTPSEVPITQRFVFANGYAGSYDDMYLWKRAFSEEEVREIP